MNLWRWFRQWQHDRLARKTFYRAGLLVAQEANQRMFDRTGRELSDEDQDHIAAEFVRTLFAPERLDAFLDNPVRSVHLFLSEVL